MSNDVLARSLEAKVLAAERGTPRLRVLKDAIASANSLGCDASASGQDPTEHIATEHRACLELTKLGESGQAVGGDRLGRMKSG